MRSGYKHYRNSAGAGSCVFVTTTCLDFVHAFASPPARDLMALSLLDDVRHYGAALNAYVVMPHHIHLLMMLPVDQEVSSMVQRLKSNSAKRVKRVLSAETIKAFDQQTGLNRRTFWKVGFRSIMITEERNFWRKARYIHRNPLRAGLCEQAEDYRWSSACDWAAGLWDNENGLELKGAALRFAESVPFLPLGRNIGKTRTLNIREC